MLPVQEWHEGKYEGGVGAPSCEPGSAPLQQLPEASPYKTLTDSRTKTDSRERHRLGDRLCTHVRVHVHTHTHELAPSFGMIHPSPGDRV